MSKEMYIEIQEDGPYLLYGAAQISEKIIVADAHGISVKYGDGKVFEIKSDPVALCRCGHSKNAPFCDGSHTNAGFDGTETADKTPIMEQPSAEALEGPELTLLDNQDYCAFARFCDRGGRIWNLVMSGENPELAIQEANLCPSGRLIMLNPSGESLEEESAQAVHVIEDSKLKVSGPLWLRGSIKVIGADGVAYEIRNKQTLCRCGASQNKPFCNGAHASIHFHAKTSE